MTHTCIPPSSLMAGKAITVTTFRDCGWISSTKCPSAWRWLERGVVALTVLSQGKKFSLSLPRELCQKFALQTVSLFYFWAVTKQSQGKA